MELMTSNFSVGGRNPSEIQSQISRSFPDQQEHLGHWDPWIIVVFLQCNLLGIWDFLHSPHVWETLFLSGLTAAISSPITTSNLILIEQVMLFWCLLGQKPKYIIAKYIYYSMKPNGFKNRSINKMEGKISWDKTCDSAMVTLLPVLQLSARMTLQGK